VESPVLSNGHAGFGRGPAGNARWQHRNARPWAYLTNGSSHRGRKAIDRMAKAWPTATMVHTPVHASWLNQCEIYFSVVQRKVVTPNDFYDLADIAARLAAFEDHYNFAASPFNWKYTKQDLNDLFKRLAAHDAGPLTGAAYPPTN
jgi:uncharacterized protein YdaL